MSNTPIKKSFLFKLSPPFIRRLAPPNLLNAPIFIIANKCSIINRVFCDIILVEKRINMNNLTIFMFIFGTILILIGLYMYTGHKLGIMTERPAFKNLTINEWKNIGKWVMISSLLFYLIGILAWIFNFE